MQTTILCLGGSLIAPDKVDIDFLKDFRQLILGLDHRFVLVCGGGNVCREYQKAASDITEVRAVDRDWIGIAATKLNAELIRAILADQAYEKVLGDPEEYIETDKKILVGAGYLPGHSSDMDTVLLAKTYSSDTVINMSNIDMVYDKDPKSHADANPIKEISWKEFLKLTGEEWVPGKNVPFDPSASKKAHELGLKVIILNGKKLDNLKDCMEGRAFVGTVIE